MHRLRDRVVTVFAWSALGMTLLWLLLQLLDFLGPEGASRFGVEIVLWS